ncbi:MAG: bifunctional adenosylcobinamide kinase/adenosylcobinamide-phosphate guanylyltransferase, partial [Pseudomonadota bacterium]
GGARSGKSARALTLAAAPKTFLATAEALDWEMKDRIEAHRLERGPDWELIEEPLEISDPISRHPDGTLLIDCLTLWLSNLMHAERDVEAAAEELCDALRAATARIILVSNEVGLSIAPENALARRFRDAQGRLNQQVAAVADHVEFMAAGLPMVLKGSP